MIAFSMYYEYIKSKGTTDLTLKNKKKANAMKFMLFYVELSFYESEL